MKKVCFLALFLALLSYQMAIAGDVIFETTLKWYQWWSEILWGNGSLTYTRSFAITYKPSSNQEVCTIKAGFYKSGNPSDDVVMTVRENTTGYPTHGQIISTITIPGSDVSGSPVLPQQAAYTTFLVNPCLNLTAGLNYTLVFSRTQPDPSNYYFVQLTNLVSYPETRFWGYVPVNGFWQEKVGYEPALRLEGPEPKNKEPVIIVPGILGSRLNRVSDGEEVWPETLKMVDPFHPDDEYLNDLKLNSAGEEIIDINHGEIVSSVFGLNQYGNLIQKFKDNGYELGTDLFIVPYDWRLDIRTSSQELDSVIAQALDNSSTGKVNIIAHSMGGLLVKDYLIRKGDLAVNKLLFAGTPHLGAPKAFNALNYGDDFGLKFFMFGLNKNKAKDISQNMPAVYELLPSREYVSRAGPYVQNDQLQDLDYDQTNQFMISSSLLLDYRNNNLLNVADRLHQFLDNWLPQSANVYNLMGCREYDTMGSFKIDSNGSIDIDSVNGDGTVPLISANHVPGNGYFVSYPETKIDHTGLISDDRTIDLLYDLVVLNNQPVLPSGVYRTSIECDSILSQVKRLRFSTHSPVNLHVYDSLGNHTGLTPEDNIETNIPDSNFLQVGENNFIFIPEGALYSVKIDAYATGSFDFKIKELSNGQVEQSVVYDNIPINNPELEADIEFTGINESALLNLDENGDGENDVGYSSNGERILYKGVDNLIADINMAYDLGWISTERERDSYLRKVSRIIKIEKRIEILEEKLPDGKKKEKWIGHLERRIDKVLAIQFLKDLEKSYTKKQLNEQAFNLIKEDILWLLRN
ncbi:MAG TPA: hypothetical protein VJI73_00475 [Candidatus Paceibacterota bacterium]